MKKLYPSRKAFVFPFSIKIRLSIIVQSRSIIDYSDLLEKQFISDKLQTFYIYIYIREIQTLHLWALETNAEEERCKCGSRCTFGLYFSSSECIWGTWIPWVNHPLLQDSSVAYWTSVSCAQCDIGWNPQLQTWNHNVYLVVSMYFTLYSLVNKGYQQTSNGHNGTLCLVMPAYMGKVTAL